MDKERVEHFHDLESQIKHRLEFENTIRRISTEFVSLPLDEIDDGINRALKTISEFTRAGRSYIFLFDLENKIMNNTYEWTGSGASSQKDCLQGLPFDSFPWWTSRIRRFESINIPDISSLPLEASREAEFLLANETAASIAVPLVYQNLAIGFLGLDSIRDAETWTGDILIFLGICADNFTNLLARKKRDEATLKATADMEFLANELQELNAAIIDMDENERKRFAGILHEGIGQNLAAIRLQCFNMQRNVLDSALIVKDLACVISILDDTIRSTRAVASEIYSAPFDNLNIRDTIKWYLEAFLEKRNIEVSVDIDDCCIVSINEGRKNALFRITREFLQNTLKHSKADSVSLSCKKDGAAIIYEIKDNGIGFHHDGIAIKNGKGFGLIIMRECARSINAGFSLQSEPGKGTQVILKLTQA